MRVAKPVRIFAFLVAAAGAPAVALAGEAQPMAADPELEKRVEQVASELRCLVCQNQTIADSHAELAVDLKNQVRDMLREGKSNDDVVNYMVARYGDFVRYKPPVNPATWFLWFGPGILIVGGLLVLFVTLRKRHQRVAATAPLSADDAKKVEELLQSGRGRSASPSPGPAGHPLPAGEGVSPRPSAGDVQ
jgi:cytochrome c-type biogenesis protein CcmH